MQTSLIVLAGACFSFANALTADLVGTECGAKRLADGYCCCEIIGESPRSGIVVRARKVGEQDPLIEDSCDSSASTRRSSSSATCNAPKRVENWCADTAQCNKSITCQEGKSCMSDFRIFGGCSCNPYCAVTGSCCPECRVQCEKAAKRQKLVAVANSCASTCVGTPLGGNCSCAPSCVMSNTCCLDFQDHCAKKVTQFFDTLNKDRDQAITKNDLNFAVGRMLLGRQSSVSHSHRRLAAISDATEQATQDGKVVANCVMAITKGLLIGREIDDSGKTAYKRTGYKTVNTRNGWKTRALGKADIEILCKATPLKSVKGRSLSVDEWEFLKSFCSMHTSKGSSVPTAQLKVKTQVGLCHIGEELSSDTCTGIQLARATMIVGGEPNADVVGKDLARKRKSQMDEAKEMRKHILDDVCHETELTIDQIANAQALQDIKLIKGSKAEDVKPLQSGAIESFQQLHDLATEAQDILRTKLEQIASQDKAIEAKTAGVKTASRAKDKIAADYSCNWRQITDLCRGTLRTTCGSSCKMGALVHAYNKVGDVLEWKFLKNNWATPRGNGYADLNGLVAVSVKGFEVICELQIQLYDVEYIKSGEEHAIYELKSQILRSAQNKEAEKALEKSPEVMKLNKQAFGLYEKVWNKCFGVKPYVGDDPKNEIKVA